MRSVRKDVKMCIFAHATEKIMLSRFRKELFMNFQNSGSFLDRLIAMYAKAGFPAAILNNHFNIIWCSDSAKLSFPALSLPDGARTLLTGCDLAQIKEKIKIDGVYTNTNIAEPFGYPSISICELPSDDSELYLMQLSASSPQGTGMQPEGVSRVLSAINSQYRAPISTIFSTLSLMAQEMKQNSSGNDSTKLLAHLETINQNCYKVLRSCELLTTYTRLTGGLSSMRPVRMDLFSFLGSLFKVCAEMTVRSGIPLFYEVPEGVLITSCDQTKLVCAIMCVLSNSCRFTQENNSIDIRVRQMENSISISITDRGAGIPSHVQPHVFEPYFSFSKDSGPFVGNGLGLPIAKQVVCALGGTIALTSVENEGTTVIFTLPVADDTTAPPTVNSDAIDYLNDRFSIPWVYLSDGVRCPL